MSQPQKRRGAAVVVENKRGSLPKEKPPNVPQAPDNGVTDKNRNNKIPKSIRYDLQNALINLCDVWFEDIKPHLVRNNIKLHTHEQKPKASGDFVRPPGASGCSHLDPGAAPDRCRRRGANSADYCSTLPTASRAPCPKRPPVKPPLSPVISLPTTPKLSTQIILPDYKDSPKPRARRKRRRQQTEKYASSNQQCVVPPLSLTSSSQWPPTPRKEYGCHPLNNNSYTQPPPQLSPYSKRTYLKTKGTQTDFKWCTCNEKAFKRPVGTRSPVSKHIACSPLSPLSPVKGGKMPSSPLFKEDLIDILGGTNDKMLNVLYNNPARRDNYSSIISLCAHEASEASYVKKRPPWR